MDEGSRRRGAETGQCRVPRELALESVKRKEEAMLKLWGWIMGTLLLPNYDFPPPWPPN